MKRKPKIPAKRAPKPKGYDDVRMKKQQGSPGLQDVEEFTYYIVDLHLQPLDARF